MSLALLLFRGGGGGSAANTYTISPTGLITLSGTAPVTYISVKSYTISPSGTLLFSGTLPLSRTHVQANANGLISFSGTSVQTRVRATPSSGTLLFSGTLAQVRTRILSPLGLVVFSGSASVTFTAAGAVSTKQRTMVGTGL